MFKLEINTGNAAFCNPMTGEEDDYWEGVEINRILIAVREKIEQGETSGKCYDINGNKVGEWKR